MLYIIDANNLAGKLGLLAEEDFDLILIKIIKAFFLNQKHKNFLVFDSNLTMGDRSDEGNLTVIYTPRDSYYNSADDKIVELTQKLLKDKSSPLITVISDDIEIKEQVKKIAEKQNKEIRIKKASEFSVQINEFLINIDEREEDNDLSDNEVENMNKELLEEWKNTHNA